MAQTLAPADAPVPTAAPSLSRHVGALGAVLLVVCLAAFPHVVTSSYYIHLVVVIAIYAILILGLDIVVGYTGQVSLGHAGLFGVGAYAAAVLFLHFKLGGVWWGILAGIGVTSAFGVLLAVPALRVTGPYLAMVTLAFGTIIQIFINELTPLTNGPSASPCRRPASSTSRSSASRPRGAQPGASSNSTTSSASRCWPQSWSSTGWCALPTAAPSRRCGTRRSPATAWASASTATRSMPS